MTLLEEWFVVLKGNNARLRADKCTLMVEEMTYLGFEMGYGWWRPDPAKLQPLVEFGIEKGEGKKKGVRSVREFIGGANFYRRHVRAFTHSSAPLTDLIRESSKWEWSEKEEQAFYELKKKISFVKLLGCPRAEGEIVLITDASNVGGGGSLYQWQRVKKDKYEKIMEKLETLGVNHEKLETLGVNKDGSLKHNYPEEDYILVPLGHWNWKWREGRVNFFTYEQELLAGVLVLCSKSRIIGTNSILWLTV